jgi:hypothetical protein
MKCKNCGSNNDTVSVRQNLYNQFGNSQYIFLCNKCYRQITPITWDATKWQEYTGKYNHINDL